MAPPILLSPLPLPEKVWEDISMDFIEGLPTSHGKNVIMVIVDRYSKFAHFIPLQHPFTASKVAQVFFDEIFSLYGLPKTIASDRDPIFRSSFSSELLKLQGTQLHLSSSYHPQSGSQAERINQYLECYLRCFCSTKLNEWRKWVALAMFWHNTMWKSSMGFTLYEVWEATINCAELHSEDGKNTSGGVFL